MKLMKSVESLCRQINSTDGSIAADKWQKHSEIQKDRNCGTAWDTTAMSLLTSDGLLADHAETTITALCENLAKRRMWNTKELRQRTGMQTIQTLSQQIVRSLPTPKKTRSNKRTTPNTNETIPANWKKDLVHSQNALKSLKKHLEKQTCPKSLQYRARACQHKGGRWIQERH